MSYVSTMGIGHDSEVVAWKNELQMTMALQVIVKGTTA